MIYKIEDCERMAYGAANGGFKIPGKFYPDVSKWDDNSISDFFRVSYPKGAPTKGYIQKHADINKMQQDEAAHDWIGNYERKLKQDAFNAAHPQKPLPKKAPPKIHKRTWLTRRLPEVEYASLSEHQLDTVGDTSSYAWSSDNTTVATVAASTTNTTTATGKAVGKANIIAKLTTTDTEGKTGTSTGQAPLTVTAAPVVPATIKTATTSTPNTFDATIGQRAIIPVTLTLDEPDDGTYTYTWACNGNGTGCGYVYSDSAATKSAPSGGTGLSTVYVSTSSTTATVNQLKPLYLGCTIKDENGNTVYFPTGWSGGINDNTTNFAITLN
ncbi:TPA: hypothetical protein L8N48_003694 [Klebsiella pneumoniae]|nr:hypothetical protein [Klebsiella pneumoniae]